MNETGESIEFVDERGGLTRAMVIQMAQPPTSFVYPPFTPEVFQGLVQSFRGGCDALLGGEIDTQTAGLEWDAVVDALHADVVLGLAVARQHFADAPEKLGLFQGIRLNNTGRESRHKQALEFEMAWKNADATWVFKEGLTLAVFRTRRRALRDMEETHMDVWKKEQLARGQLHNRANELNEASVNWYDIATAVFGEDTVAGGTIRTLPTTYDPNRPPGPLVFTRVETPGAGAASLRWRAPRGRSTLLEGLAPGASEWVELFDGEKENSWTGRNLAGGRWKFRGRAENKFGAGTMSEPVELDIAAVQAA